MLALARFINSTRMLHRVGFGMYTTEHLGMMPLNGFLGNEGTT